MKIGIQCPYLRSTLQLHLKQLREDDTSTNIDQKRTTGRNQALQIVFVIVFSFYNVLALSGFAFSDTCSGKIIYPWNATTAIVKMGDSFDVWFNSIPGQAVKSAVLKGPYNTIRIAPD